MLAALAAAPSGAQEPEPSRAGLELARSRCAQCHAVERGNRRSIVADAPAFSIIAAVRGVSARALAAMLQTSHSAMPDIMLTSRQRTDVIAYILSLRGS